MARRRRPPYDCGMRKLLTRTLGAGLLFVALTPAPAHADGMLIPFLGVNFAGDSGKELEDAIDASRFNWGVSFAYMGGGVLGLEGDIGYSPDFFGKTDLGGSSLLTVTGNILFGIPFGGQKGSGRTRSSASASSGRGSTRSAMCWSSTTARPRGTLAAA
jgi:hypothetical protein